MQGWEKGNGIINLIEIKMDTKNQNSTRDTQSGKAGVIPRFLFGEWVLIDKEKSGQIIDCYGSSCMVDENGMWTEYQKERLTKDTRYLTPAEYYELNGA